LQVPDKNIVTRRIPSLFQHIGLISTLPNKLQKLEDSTFRMAERKILNKNPPADVLTTMTVYNDFRPEYAYRATPGFFWGITKSEDTYDIVLHKPTNVSRILIYSGMPEKKKKKIVMKDVIADGVLQISDTYIKTFSNLSAGCENFVEIGEFTDGNVDVSVDPGTKVQCVRIKIGAGQKSWAIIREIEIIK